MDYTMLSLAEVRSALQDVARDAQATFGALDARQLNWRPTETRWSVAQCLLHLVTSNDLMVQAARSALTGPPGSMWQRVPILPRFVGPALIRSQAPTTTRKYKSPAKSQPMTSDIPADILERFVGQQRELAEWAGTLDERESARAIMLSPFIAFVAYSVLDANRLMVAHDHRHVEQARRVLREPAFPV